MTTLGIFPAQAMISLDQSVWIGRQQLLSPASEVLGVVHGGGPAIGRWPAPRRRRTMENA